MESEQNIIFEGKIIQKGLFFSIDSYDVEKTNFVKNYLYTQILPNDIILYNVCDNGYVNIIKIKYRKIFKTIGIYTASDPKSNKHYFFTPLLSRNFNCFIQSNDQNFKNLLNVKHRYIIKIGKDYNTLIDDYGHIDSRINDHKILNDIYNDVDIPNPPYYNLKIHKLKDTSYNCNDCDGCDESDKCESNNNNIKKNFFTKGFQNLQHLNTFNIDPVQSKDFDDALSFDPITKKIYVHIVDANQLQLESFVEKRAAYLSLTFYNHFENVNMLPKNLSENHFSLLRGKKRQVITVEFSVDESKDYDKGKLPILFYDIYPSVIIVKNRYDYDNVLVLENDTNSCFPYLKSLCDKYYKRRLNIVQPTYKIDSNNGKLNEIYYENMNSWSHTLIEMMMINANRIVTEHMNQVSMNKIPQRIHPEPISLNIEDHITGDELIDSIIMIQKYRTASYNKDTHGHYGLNLEHYTHFTSPIRRYNDVIVMRMINGYVYENLDALLEHINHRESLNSDFEKIYKRWKLLSYLEDHKEDTYDAYITNITKFGIKFYIKSIGFDGFILQKNAIYRVGEKIALKCNYINFTSFDDVNWDIL